ncbi:hypothetical protein L1987_78064 [Smallanthus sonchifolius]|uniref:Uncharacterized protein n=1 Tax=Smallanthus sonchifolius TaxID=185202 RepID=A0ACB8ZBF2_9ASTR|nr:hypothetical protein L1987_78064 [Smallanthus sonchifolius]
MEGENSANAINREIMLSIEYTINCLSSNMGELSLYNEYVKSYMAMADDVHIVAPPPSKRDRVAELTWHTQSNGHPVRNPVGIRNKGCGMHKRLNNMDIMLQLVLLKI